MFGIRSRLEATSVGRLSTPSGASLILEAPDRTVLPCPGLVLPSGHNAPSPNVVFPPAHGAPSLRLNVLLLVWVLPPGLNASSVFPPGLCFAAFPGLVFSHRPGAPFPILGILSWAQYFLVSMLSPRLLEDTDFRAQYFLSQAQCSFPGTVLSGSYSAWLRDAHCILLFLTPMELAGLREEAEVVQGLSTASSPWVSCQDGGVDLPCSLTEAIVLEPVSTSCLECACLSSPRLFRKAHLTLHGLHPSAKA